MPTVCRGAPNDAAAGFGMRLKRFIKAKPSLEGRVRKLLPLASRAATFYARWLLTPLNLWRNGHKRERLLEIGPDNTRIDGFETLSIVWGRNVDYIGDASKRLPFKDDTFDLVYCSHVLEHIPWYQSEESLKEWVRVLRPGGQLEVWVPDGLKICEALVDFELLGEDRIDLDGWYRYNPGKDPCKWAAGRLFTYGDGTGSSVHPNWHRALFTPRYLKTLLETIGLQRVRELGSKEARGHDHGWINLGMTGVKKE